MKSSLGRGIAALALSSGVLVAGTTSASAAGSGSSDVPANWPKPVAHPSVAGKTPPASLQTFGSCAELHEVFPYGVGQSDAHDKDQNTDVVKSLSEADVNFYPSNSVYASQPKALDHDKDGIMCEGDNPSYGKVGDVNYYPDRAVDGMGSVPADTKKATTPAKAVSNPYTDCATAEKKHLGPIDSKNTWYDAKLDPNHNGIACEANTVWREGKAYVLASSVRHTGAPALTYLGHGYVAESAASTRGPKINTDGVVLSSGGASTSAGLVGLGGEAVGASVAGLGLLVLARAGMARRRVAS